MRKIIHLGAVSAFSLFLFTTLGGFGTTHVGGQNAEHERITRHALSCQYSGVRDQLGGFCFQPDTIKTLAGTIGEFGAVGEPDSGRLIFVSKAHCDNGDYLNRSDYPRSKKDANDALYACRAWMVENMNGAVAEAARLLNKDGGVDRFQARFDCVFLFRMDGKAKCNILERLGLLLHASQDFYSHSNWTDAKNSKNDTETPPGLARSGPAAFISLREGDTKALEPLPDGLITGCFKFVPESLYCGGHVRHAVLNKDKGQIDPTIGEGKTDRGKVGDNFKHAVEAAIQDTQDKWKVFNEKLVQAYGEQKARLMACIVTADHPDRTCRA